MRNEEIIFGARNNGGEFANRTIFINGGVENDGLENDGGESSREWMRFETGRAERFLKSFPTRGTIAPPPPAPHPLEEAMQARYKKWQRPRILPPRFFRSARFFPVPQSRAHVDPNV